MTLSSSSVTDPKLPFLRDALNPRQVQQALMHHLPQVAESFHVVAAHLVRHKLGRRCLIEYELAPIEGMAAHPWRLLGKIRAKGTDYKSYQLQQILWQQGFDADSADRISVPEPVGLIPEWQMWLQRKVPGVQATELLPTDAGLALAARVAQVATKLHQAPADPKREHTIAAELQILQDRLPRVLEVHPHWQPRIEQVLIRCDRVAAQTPEPSQCGIHRDFYADQILVDGDRLYLVDLDLYCQGSPALDIGNFMAHITEQSLRTLGQPDALGDREIALREAFLQQAGEAFRPAVEAYTVLTLVRHIFISTQIAERRPYTEPLLDFCETRLQAWS